MKRSRLQSTEEPEDPHLAGDPVAVLALPLPDLFDEALTPEVVTGEPFDRQLALDDVLGGDAGMVGTWNPQGSESLHALATNDDVVEGVVEGVAEVELPGHVRRRNHHAERIAIGSVLGAEHTGVFPRRRTSGPRSPADRTWTPSSSSLDRLLHQ